MGCSSAIDKTIQNLPTYKLLYCSIDNANKPQPNFIDISQQVFEHDGISGSEIIKLLKEKSPNANIIHFQHTLEDQSQVWERLAEHKEFTREDLDKHNGEILLLLRVMENKFHDLLEIKKQISEMKDQFNQINSTPPSFRILKKSTLDAAERPSIDIAYLFSAPLIKQEGNNIIDLDCILDYNAEFESIKSSLDDTKKSIEIFKTNATKNNLKDVLCRRPKMLHITSHGAYDKNRGEYYLVFESDECMGRQQNIYTKDLKDILESYKSEVSEIKFAFVSACHSQKIGEVFRDAGIKCVIAVNSGTLINDEASQEFAKIFYRQIFVHDDTIKGSFDKGICAVKTKKIPCCCCSHDHDDDCPFIKKYIEVNEKEKTEMHFKHMPDNTCVCSIANRDCNWHEFECIWCNGLENYYENIKNGFEFQTEEGTDVDFSGNKKMYKISCCCKPKFPHNESKKFLLLTSKNDDSNIKIFGGMSVKEDGNINVTSVSQFEYSSANVSLGTQIGRVINLYQLITMMNNAGIINLYGAEGTGKKTLTIRAMKYIEERNSVFKGSAIIDMKNTTSEAMLIGCLAKNIGLSILSRQALEKELSKVRIMIGVFNCNEEKQVALNKFLSYITTLASYSKGICVVITSKNKLSSHIAIKNFISPSPLNIYEAAKFIIEFAGRMLGSSYKNTFNEYEALRDISVLKDNEKNLQINFLMAIVRKIEDSKYCDLDSLKVDIKNEVTGSNKELIYSMLVKTIQFNQKHFDIFKQMAFYNSEVHIKDFCAIGNHDTKDVWALLSKIQYIDSQKKSSLIHYLNINLRDYIRRECISPEEEIAYVEAMFKYYSNILSSMIKAKIKEKNYYQTIYNFNSIVESSIWSKMVVHDESSVEYDPKMVNSYECTIHMLLCNKLPKLNDFSYYGSTLVQYCTYLDIDGKYYEGIEICTNSYESMNPHAKSLESELLNIGILQASLMLKNTMESNYDLHKLQEEILECTNKCTELESYAIDKKTLQAQIWLLASLVLYFAEHNDIFSNTESEQNERSKNDCIKYINLAYNSCEESSYSQAIVLLSYCIFLHNDSSYLKQEDSKMIAQRYNKLNILRNIHFSPLKQPKTSDDYRPSTLLELYCVSGLLLAKFFSESESSCNQAIELLDEIKLLISNKESATINTYKFQIEKQIKDKILTMSSNSITFLHAHPLKYFDEGTLKVSPFYCRSIDSFKRLMSSSGFGQLQLEAVFNTNYAKMSHEKIVSSITKGNSIVQLMSIAGLETTDLLCENEYFEGKLISVEKIVNELKHNTISCKLLVLICKNSFEIAEKFSELPIPHIIAISLSFEDIIVELHSTSIKQFLWEEMLIQFLGKLYTKIYQGNFVSTAFNGAKSSVGTTFSNECKMSLEKAIQLYPQANDGNHDECIYKASITKGLINDLKTAILFNEEATASKLPPLLSRNDSLAALLNIIVHDKQQKISIIGRKGVGMTRVLFELAMILRQSELDLSAIYYIDIRGYSRLKLKKAIEERSIFINKKTLLMLDHVSHNDKLLNSYILELNCAVIVVSKHIFEGIPEPYVIEPLKLAKDSINIMRMQFISAGKTEYLSDFHKNQLLGSKCFQSIHGFPYLLVELAESIISKGFGCLSFWHSKRIAYQTEAAKYNNKPL